MLTALFLRYRLSVENEKFHISEGFGVPDLIRNERVQEREGASAERNERIRGLEGGFRYMLWARIQHIVEIRAYHKVVWYVVVIGYYVCVARYAVASSQSGIHINIEPKYINTSYRPYGEHSLSVVGKFDLYYWYTLPLPQTLLWSFTYCNTYQEAFFSFFQNKNKTDYVMLTTTWWLHDNEQRSGKNSHRVLDKK